MRRRDYHLRRRRLISLRFILPPRRFPTVLPTPGAGNHPTVMDYGELLEVVQPVRPSVFDRSDSVLSETWAEKRTQRIFDRCELPIVVFIPLDLVVFLGLPKALDLLLDRIILLQLQRAQIYQLARLNGNDLLLQFEGFDAFAP